MKLHFRVAVALSIPLHVWSVYGQTTAPIVAQPTRGVERPLVDDPSADESPSTREAGIAMPEDDLHDAAFDRYVDIHMVADAVDALDASLLTDAGLQLAEGERILGRPHKAIGSDELLELAAKIAVEGQEKEPIARLKEAAAVLKKKGLAEFIENAEKIGGSSRSIGGGLMVPIDRLRSGCGLLLQEYVDAIRRARLLKNLDSLKRIAEGLDGEADLPDEHREYLEKILQEAKAATEKTADGSANSLSKLAAASRGWFSDATGIRTPEPIRKIAPKGISITPRETTSTIPVLPAYACKGIKFSVTNNSGRPLYLRVYFRVREHGRTEDRHFNHRKYAARSATVTWTTTAHTEQDIVRSGDYYAVGVRAYDPNTGRGIRVWGTASHPDKFMRIRRSTTIAGQNSHYLHLRMAVGGW